LSPEADRLLVSSSKGVFQIAKDRRFGPVPGLGPEYRGGPVELPWDGGVFIAAADGAHLVLEKSGQSRPVRNEVGRSGTLTGHAVLPSLRTVLLGNGSSFPYYFGPDDTVARIKDDKGKGVVLNQLPAETPWLGGDLVNYFGPKLFRPGEPLQPLPLEGNDSSQIAAMRNSPGPFYALSRFRSVLIPTRKGWKRFTEDRRIEEVAGIDPALTSILAIADPGRGDVLLGTAEGLYRIDEKGAASRIMEAGRGAVRVLRHSSALNGLMAGGEDGLFRVVDGSRIVPVAQGDPMTIGAVFGAVDVPWARLTLIAAARGFFVLESNEMISRLDTSPTGGHSPFQAMSAFAPLQGVFVFGPARGVSRGAIFELGRRSEAGVCSEAL
jgi:hypothetical protein